MDLTTRKTIAAYNKNAEKYAAKFDHYPVYQRRVAGFQEKYIPAGAHIIDLGCGPGNNIRTILDRDQTCSFTGVDLSVEFIQLAKSRFPQCNFLQLDIREVVCERIYDVVLASFCIVHLCNEDTSRLIRNVSGCLKKGGSLYLSYMNGCNAGFESTSFSEEEIYFNYYEDSYIMQLLRSNGFDVSEILKDDYVEPDGAITTDSFIYARKF